MARKGLLLGSQKSATSPYPEPVESSSYLRGCIQKFPDWVDNEIYAYLWYYSLRRNTKGHGGKTH
jgi:hypothetical protein